MDAMGDGLASIIYEDHELLQGLHEKQDVSIGLLQEAKGKSDAQAEMLDKVHAGRAAGRGRRLRAGPRAPVLQLRYSFLKP